MNRPRNRQPRPNRQSQGQPRRGGGGSSNTHSHANERSTPATPQQASGTVPLARQVNPGVNVYVILKEDQSTGRETQGVVQDVLTSGDHWRGVKVRLRGGLVGRVQRLVDESNPSSETTGEGEENLDGRVSASAPPRGRFAGRYTDIRQDEELEEPPPRSLADFIRFPDEEQGESARGDEGFAADGQQHDFKGAGIKCPICEAFEGDEMAVTHHIEQQHFS